ncbi:MAG: hypothetical protein QOK13_1313 [Gaiellaceae bacterium]|nr:hypothetical protein [Gaiellaceae bacterium]
MTDRPNVSQEVTAYLAAVSEALSDLPEEERDDLLAEVETSLVEAGGPVAARLGPPDEFAAELRAAAGLHREPEASRSESRLVAWLRRAGADRRIVAARPVLARLAPIWWAIRGYVVVAALALLVGATWSTSHPQVPRLGTGATGLFAIVVAVALSVLLGLRGFRGPLWTLANVALVLVALPVAQHLAERAPQQIIVAYVQTSVVEPQGLSYDMAPVQNIYPFSRSGRLLHDVLLYDGRGYPLEIGRHAPDAARRYVLNRAGNRLYNTFPIRYFEPGTAVVAHPDAIPPVRFPRLLTASLSAKP